jgi:hypothetical protein
MSPYALRFTGIGGLCDLLLGIVISLAMISLPDLAGPGPKAIVQLLGPNVTTLVGALGATTHRTKTRKSGGSTGRRRADRARERG